MIINKVQLTNIGAYKGINNIDFSPNDNQNVILIGGENGAGKTTLLNAIKLGLFGSYGYGFKSESTGYYKRVSNILNQQAVKNNDNNFRIVIEFTLIEGFEKTNYKLYRFWKFTNTSLKESIDIISNGKQLSEYERDLFQTRLKEIMPPQLLDLCLFDGEEISRIVNEDLLSSYLQTLSRVVFNLDLFDTLEADLETYSNQSLDIKKMESSEQELYHLNKKERELRDLLIKTTERLKAFENEKNDLEDEYARLKNDFEKHGGLKKTERDETIKTIHELEGSRKQNLEKIREFVSSLLPFYLSKELLKQTRIQIQEEESLQLFKQLDTKLTDHSLSAILRNVNGSTNEETSKILKKQLLEIMKPKNEISQIHGSSFSESSLIENMYNKVVSEQDQACLETLEDNKQKLIELQSLREMLKVNDTTNEFSEMIQGMETIQQRLNILENEINETVIKVDEGRKELDSTFSAIDKIQSILRDSDKTKSSFLESQKIIALSRRFREIQLKKKLQEVQIESSIMLKRILRKHNYVASISINPETYDVMLLDSNKEPIEKTTLSAGEKQILLLSIIWAIFKCSGRKVPFIFDTLLGRLDKTHKAAIIREFIPNSGRQAIILSTDTEIDEEHFNILKESVAKEYMLDFNVERKETNIINQYFPFKAKEVRS
ncbi:DNA sulfur modification protein DndD [Cytobacillus gottheilii]|uniref:DNA sulfur modification protein DndD n=1 Tax=Cytobacillus gottheilii TaxID=859144 RepID=UPI003CECBFF7